MSAAQKSTANGSAQQSAAPAAAIAAAPSSKQDDVRARMAEVASEIQDTEEKYQAQKQRLDISYEDTGVPDVPAILSDALWKPPLTIEFKAKYLEHKIKGVKALAELHTRIAALQQELKELKATSEKIVIEDKVEELDDEMRVMYLKLESIGARLNGVIKVDAKVSHNRSSCFGL